MADGESVRVMSEYAPGEKETPATGGAFRGPTGEPNVKGHVAVSPNLLLPNGGNHWYGEHVNVVDKNGNVLRNGLQIHDFSYWNKETPTKNSIELADDHELPDSILVHDPDYPDEQPSEHQKNFGKIDSDALARSQFRAGDVPQGAVFKRQNSAPEGAVKKRPATQAEVSAATQDYEQQAPPGPKPAPAPTPAPEAEQPPEEEQPTQAAEHPITQDQMDANQAAAQRDPDAQNIEDPNARAAAIYDKTMGLNLDNHSANVVPTDQRVTRRINPDTGSNKIVGSYFVPGDPLHEDLLQNLDPTERAKLPWLSQAILRGGPFSYMYGSAQQEGGPAESEGERPTGESRAYEIGQSPAAQRISGEHQTQEQRVTMLPMQMMATMPKVDKPANVLLEGLGSDAVMNNAQHLINGAGQAKIPAAYNDPKDPNFQRDLMGFLENQVHGFKGDGSPMLDENGQPHPLHVANAASENPYIPHLLQRPQAEFIHAMLNIRPPKNPKAPLQPPGFGERASWQRRINEGYTGQPAGYNGLLNQLDQKLPQVGMRGKKGNITRHVPWSAGTLEPTWRAYRTELIRHGMPEIGQESMRGPVQSQLVHTAPHFRQTLAMYKPGQPAPISEDPAIGAPVGENERIAHAAYRFNDKKMAAPHLLNTPNRIYRGLNHAEAYDNALQAGEHNDFNPDEGFVTDKGRFLKRKAALQLALQARQASPSNLLYPKQGLTSEDVNEYASPQPISSNPEVGAPAGGANAPGTPGLLEQSEASQGEEPPQQQGAEFASPSIREDMTFNAAKLALNKDQHRQMKDYGNRLEQAAAQANGYEPATQSDVIGDWADGAENSIMTRHQGHDPKTRKLVLALKGLHSAQKQVASFRRHDDGEHDLYSLQFHTDKPEEVRQHLDAQGIKFRSLQPGGKGQPTWAHVIDNSDDQSALGGIEKLIKGGHVTDAHHWNGTAEFHGDPNGTSREEAAKEYRRILEEARSGGDQAPLEQGQKRSGVPGPSWWQPFADEAEQNFQNLRASDVYEKQALGEDLRNAAIDRENISPQEREGLNEVKGKAQNWIDRNPELHPLAAHQYLQGHEQFPENVKDNEGIAKHFETVNEPLDYSNPDHRKVAADALTHDIMHALAGDSRAHGWYDRAVKKAMSKIGEVAPEILSDPKSARAFKLATAITSQGQDVFANFDTAWRIYQHWKKTGEFPTADTEDPGKTEEWTKQFGGGIKAPAMIKNFAKVNRLMAEHGDEGFDKLLNTSMTVGQLAKEHGLKVPKTNVNNVLPGSAFLGPKIGVFYQNLNGNYDPVTMDLWFSRTMNRLAGNMFGFSPSALREDKGKNVSQLKQVQQLLDSGHPLTGVSDREKVTMGREIGKLMKAKDLTREKAMALAPTVLNWAEAQHKRYQKGTGGRSYPKELKTPETAAAKNIDENIHSLQDDPRHGTERDHWNKVMDEVASNMDNAGIKITNADRQALLWYLEQRMFQGVSGSSTSFDYLDAAHHLVRRVKNGEM